jgi:hypothetical protein
MLESFVVTVPVMHLCTTELSFHSHTLTSYALRTAEATPNTHKIPSKIPHSQRLLPSAEQVGQALEGFELVHVQ